VVTNQSGVARGYFDEAAVHGFHAAMQASLAEAGARIDAFYFCPHHVDGVAPGYCSDHPDRKPRPGMLLRAMIEWDVDPARSFMIGDRAEDVAAGEAAGVRAYRFEGGSLLELVERVIGPSPPTSEA
jgi:D-glycero-D-manno-heptose 1,7-bisphosphate phosphatase